MIRVNDGEMPVVGSTRVAPTFEDGGASLVVALMSCLVKMTVRSALQRGAMLTRVLGNDGMMWP